MYCLYFGKSPFHVSKSKVRDETQHRHSTSPGMEKMKGGKGKRKSEQEMPVFFQFPETIPPAADDQLPDFNGAWVLAEVSGDWDMFLEKARAS